jgi:Type II secretion system protein C
VKALAILGRLAALTLLVYAGVYLWYGRMVDKVGKEPTGAREEQQARQAEVANAPAENGVDFSIIVKRNIFGAVQELSEQQKAGQKAELDNLKETALKLVLLGTVSGSEKDARAIILDEKEKREDIFRVGDALQGATIARIERGKVRLNVGGRDEVLTIKERKSEGRAGAGGGAAGAVQPVEQPPEPGDAPPAQESELQGEQGEGRKVPIALPRRRINFRERNPTVVEQAEPIEPPPGQIQDGPLAEAPSEPAIDPPTDDGSQQASPAEPDAVPPPQ